MNRHHTIKALLAASALLAALLGTAAPAAAQGPMCDGKAATIVGTPGPDRIVGTNGDDVIVGLGGRDKIFGLRGNDTICGGDGPDLIKGQGGRDRLFGGQGNDRILGNNGKDVIEGQNGRDLLIGGRGNDIISSGGGNDVIDAGDDIDTCALDRKDSFNNCERGDVIGATGSGNGGFNVTPPPSWAIHTTRVGSTVDPHYVIDAVFAGDGESQFSSFIVTTFDANGDRMELFSETGPSWRGEWLLRDTPARIEVQADGPWEVALKAPKLVERVGNTFSGEGSHVVLLKTPTGPNAEAELRTMADVDGNVIVHSYAGTSFPRLRVNAIHPREDGVNTYTGPLSQGTYLIEVQIDRGSWRMTITS